MRSYNPLSIEELGKNAVRALMSYEVETLPPASVFDGAGVYTLHYDGGFPAYSNLGDCPLYVGKADTNLHRRLVEHSTSIEAADNLEIGDFSCRWLLLEQVWINLTEQILIKQYRPVWNDVLTGFGNHDPGSGRLYQKRSPWDTVHPGRPWAARLQDFNQTSSDIIRQIESYRRQFGSS